jgi:hypothetical protein
MRDHPRPAAARTWFDHWMPEFLLASVYLKPATWPDWRPSTPKRLGPCLLGPPSLQVWQVAHFALKILAPVSALPSLGPGILA